MPNGLSRANGPCAIRRGFFNWSVALSRAEWWSQVMMRQWWLGDDDETGKKLGSDEETMRREGSLLQHAHRHTVEDCRLLTAGN